MSRLVGGGCGGCRGLGAHIRWCPVRVGHIAARLGEESEKAESIGDNLSVSPEHANMAWALAASLREAANKAAAKP